MGVSKGRAERCLAATGHRSASLATDWLMAHAHDPTLDSPDHRRVFHIHLTPSKQSGLCQRLTAFRCQTQWNKGHSRPLHINMGMFRLSDDQVLAMVDTVKVVTGQQAPELAKLACPSGLELEKFQGEGGYVGLVAAKRFDAFIQGLGRALRQELSIKHQAAFDSEEAANSRLTLSQQPNPAHAHHLADMLSKLNVWSEPKDWELRLYSCDPRLAVRGEVFRVVTSGGDPGITSEGSTCVGDFVAVTDTSAASSDGAVVGTSWLTGKTVKLAKTSLEKCCQSNVWTLHACLPAYFIADKTQGEPDMLASLAGSLRVLSHKTESMASSVATSTQPKNNRDMERQIYIVRHGERVDYSFGKNWMTTCFDIAGKEYRRRDLNMPQSVPARAGGLEAWARDCPLTRIGEIEAELTGEAMADAGVNISHVFASPSLRCVQTAHHILKGLGSQGLKIHVEPGLFEWLGWYADGMPAWLSVPDLAACGYNVDESYCPYIPIDGLRDTWQQSNEPESVEQFYERNSFVTQCILQRTETKGGNLLLVAHAISGDTCSRQVTGNDPRSYEQMIQITRKVGYCGVTVLQEEEDNQESHHDHSSSSQFLRTSSESLNSRHRSTGSSFHHPKRKVWRLREPPFPPLTGVQGLPSGQQAFDWRMLLEKDTSTLSAVPQDALMSLSKLT